MTEFLRTPFGLTEVADGTPGALTEAALLARFPNALGNVEQGPEPFPGEPETPFPERSSPGGETNDLRNDFMRDFSQLSRTIDDLTQGVSSNPECTLEWAEPTRNGRGVRRVGDPSNVRLSGSGWGPNTEITVINHHAESGTNFTSVGTMRSNDEGKFSFIDETPVERERAIGNYTVTLTDGINSRQCGGFEIVKNLNVMAPPELGDQDKNEGGNICAQVVTTARDPITGEQRDFPTPCDVPQGWVTVHTSDGPADPRLAGPNGPIPVTPSNEPLDLIRRTFDLFGPGATSDDSEGEQGPTQAGFDLSGLFDLFKSGDPETSGSQSTAAGLNNLWVLAGIGGFLLFVSTREGEVSHAD